MPEHVHILLSEPEKGTLADAIHYLKLSFTKRLLSQVNAQKNGVNLGHRPQGSFWQKRYYDRNVRRAREFTVKLRYLHRNPVKRGLVQKPEDWKWSSFRHYALREVGVVEIESEWRVAHPAIQFTKSLETGWPTPPSFGGVGFFYPLSTNHHPLPCHTPR